ncbi:hypothetical protein EFT87_12970 [Schleiferilactobacillus harbinensis]|uniref:hypothetical protein n=1 Tax=Schleiferilactobacillus harbinensis TaxID=304207 RepID=UPI0021A91A7D|nr:hypothetical protein [Schleiferilactobacillus harbinensis]MCT2909563.1 hypothetical protein [Schleiferilactobacillus harbinensis]
MDDRGTNWIFSIAIFIWVTVIIGGIKLAWHLATWLIRSRYGAAKPLFAKSAGNGANGDGRNIHINK